MFLLSPYNRLPCRTAVRAGERAAVTAKVKDLEYISLMRSMR